MLAFQVRQHNLAPEEQGGGSAHQLPALGGSVAVDAPLDRRWIAAGCVEAVVQDLHLLVRAAAGRRPQPSVVIVDRRTLHSTVASGARAGVDGNTRMRGSKVHAVVDILGRLLALSVTPANKPDATEFGIRDIPAAGL
jgi:hypothetical protein